MASKSLDDGHESHSTPLLMPPLASVPLVAFDFFCGADETASAAARRNGTFKLLFSTRYAWDRGPMKQLFLDLYESIK
jgi:hypothetical protein